MTGCASGCGCRTTAGSGRSSRRSIAAGRSSELHELTQIDPWFLAQFADLVERGARRSGAGRCADVSDDELRELKRAGFGDAQIAMSTGRQRTGRTRAPPGGRPAGRLQAHRYVRRGVRVVHAVPLRHVRAGVRGRPHAEAQGADPRQRAEPHRAGHRVRLLLLSCRVRASGRGLRDGDGELQPRDGVDRLRHVRPVCTSSRSPSKTCWLSSIASGRPGGEVACLVQFGGQTPLKLSTALHDAGVRIIGTSPDSIDLAEDRKRFAALLNELGIPQPASGTASSREEAREVAGERSGTRWSCGRRTSSAAAPWPSCTTRAPSIGYMATAVDASPEHPVLVDRFLEDAFELDVDAVADATGAVVIGGIMEHIEEAGIHSGDSSCVVPPYLVKPTAPRDDPRLHAPHRAGPRRRRPDERPVRDQGRHRLRARGEPARVAHGAVPVEGHRRAAGEGGGARDGRPHAGRARPDRGPRRWTACS